jgi:circadian clock protein KaiC
MNSIVKTGISGLDAILNGGLPAGTATILEGAPGSGKTTLGMHYLYEGAIRYGEPGIYITFEEMPDQIYTDMSAFGWDLKSLERQNLLRVICMSPDTLLTQMKLNDGIFDKLMSEIKCRRLVIDSISLYKFMSDSIQKQRETLYTLRNILRKHGLTSLMIRETTHMDEGNHDFEHYLSDGIISLRVKPFMDKFRMRTIEVHKMRGRNVVSGEHRYFITENGMEIVPALTMVEDRVIISDNSALTTGIRELDHMLSGGLHRGSVYMLDTNSKANYKFLISSIYSSRLRANERTLAVLSSFTSIDSLQQMCSENGVSLDEAVKNKNAFFIEHYHRPIPDGYEDAVVNVVDLSEDDYRDVLRKSFGALLEKSMMGNDNWFIFYDLNTFFSERGRDYVQRFFAEEAAFCRSHGIVMLALCNFSEINKETGSFLERTSNGVIRTWVDGRYQYLQVTKSPTGQMSEPYVIDNISESPYIRLIMGR